MTYWDYYEEVSPGGSLRHYKVLKMEHSGNTLMHPTKITMFEYLLGKGQAEWIVEKSAGPITQFTPFYAALVDKHSREELSARRAATAEDYVNYMMEQIKVEPYIMD